MSIAKPKKSRQSRAVMLRVTADGRFEPADDMSREWLTPRGFPDWLLVSRDGGVRTKTRYVKCGRTRKRIDGRLLTKKIYQGYELVQFRVAGKNRAVRVHRLVMLAFGKGSGEGVDVNHKNGNRADNRFENLEWATRSENLKHSYRQLGRVGAMKGRPSPNRGKLLLHANCRPVVGVNAKTGETVQFRSISEAGKNGFSRDGIAHCVIGDQKTSGGYVWRYTERAAA